MEVKITTSKDLKLSKREEKIIERKINKLKRFLSGFLRHEPVLTINIEENSKKNLFKVKGYLHLKGNIDVSATNEHKVLAFAIDGMFKALIAEAKREKEKLQEKARALRNDSEMLNNKKVEVEIDNIDEIYPRLVTFANRIIIAHFYPNIELVDEINVDDVIDEAIKRLSEKKIKITENVEKSIYGEIVSVLEEYFKNIDNDENRVKIEEQIKDIESPDEYDEEFFEFFQPDALLKREDVLPDVDSDGNYKGLPTEKVLNGEIMHKIREAIKDFSPKDRKLLTLYIFEEMEPYEIAMIYQRKTDEVDEDLSRALEKLKKRIQ